MAYTKKHWLLFVIVFLLAVLAGLVFFRYGDTHWSVPKTIPNFENKNTATTTVISADEKQARQSLTDFFSLLWQKKYIEAAELFGGDWNTLVYAENKSNKPLALQQYCEATQTCLEVARIVSAAQKNKDTFVFTVQFKKQNGEVFTYGPFPDDSPTPATNTFAYTVSRVTQQWKVITPPLYMP